MSDKKSQTLILVDKKDKEIGFARKENCHEGKGLMHRAFMVFFLNKIGQLLLARRSKNKKLWPEFWDASVVSHVLKGENYKKAAVRRAEEELGLKIELKDLKEIGGFSYRSEYKNFGSENEYCLVLTADLKDKAKPNKEEISEIRYEPKLKITRELSNPNENFTPWFKIGYRIFLGRG